MLISVTIKYLSHRSLSDVNISHYVLVFSSSYYFISIEGSSYHQEKMSVDLKFVYLLSKQTYNSVSTSKTFPDLNLLVKW